MSRLLRYVPPGGALFEVTCRCIQGRALLQPSRKINSRLLGILARGLRRTGVRLVAPTVLSNHFHLLVLVRDAEQLARFMAFVNSNIARQIGPLQGWEGRFWQTRYRAIPVSEEEAAQVGRLRYLLSQGCKEGLVLKPTDWPGVHAAKAILHGRPLRGIWFDRTAYYRAKLRRPRTRRSDFERPELLTLAPLPCWAHLSIEEYRRRVQQMVRDITQETRARHRREGTRPVGRRALMRRPAHRRGRLQMRRSAPRIHAFRDRIRRAFVSAYRAFVAAFRAASSDLRNGNRQAVFPPGCFPPALPFVPPD